jgi:D-alanine-D-alanine ligase-like ATP-grasp enzyme
MHLDLTALHSANPHRPLAVIRLDPLQELRAALDEVGATQIRVADAEVYRGASPYALHPVVALRLQGAPADLPLAAVARALRATLPLPAELECAAPPERPTIASLAAELAARMIAPALDLALNWGGESEPGYELGWIERPPGSAHGPLVLLTVMALKTALAAIAEAARSGGADPGSALDRLAHLQALAMSHRRNPSSKTLILAARNRNIPFLQCGGIWQAWQFGWGSRSQMFWEAASNGDGFAGTRFAKHKVMAKRLFRELGLPTPAGYVLNREVDPLEAARAVGWPCVVKPLDGGKGNGVTANISDPADLERAVGITRARSDTILVEAHVPGSDHRLLVVNGRLVAAARREPPFTVGDGKSTVRQLIDTLNRGRKGPVREGGYLEPVTQGPALAARLAAEGVTMDSVLAPGRHLQLLTISNLSTGGTATDVTAEVHPDIRGMAELLGKAAGLWAVGIDYITRDIGRPHREIGGAFIEMNTSPGLDVHLAAGGVEDEIGAAVLGDFPGRIPVTLIVAPAGAVAETGAIVSARLRSDSGAGVAWAGHAQVGAVPLVLGGRDSTEAVTALLRHRAVTSIATVWSPQEISAAGLPVDLLEGAIVIGPPPAERWLALLARISKQVLFASSPAEAASLLRPARHDHLTL